MTDKQFVEFMSVVRQVADSLHHIALKVEAMQRDIDDFRQSASEISESIRARRGRRRLPTPEERKSWRP